MSDNALDSIWCPYFETTGKCVVGRVQGESTEYRCECGRGHTCRAGDLETAYLVFPADIDAMVDPNIKPKLSFAKS